MVQDKKRFYWDIAPPHYHLGFPSWSAEQNSTVETTGENTFHWFLFVFLNFYFEGFVRPVYGF
jgi:hypothetical protein